MSAQSTKLQKPGQVLTGRRVKNRSLKIVQETNGTYTVAYSIYFFGQVLFRKRVSCKSLAEAEQCYEDFAFRKFRGKI